VFFAVALPLAVPPVVFLAAFFAGLRTAFFSGCFSLDVRDEPSDDGREPRPAALRRAAGDLLAVTSVVSDS